MQWFSVLHTRSSCSSTEEDIAHVQRVTTVHVHAQVKTRSSAQGNCSAKSLTPVMSSILPYPHCLL